MKMRTAMCFAAIVLGMDCSIMLAQTLTTLATFNGTNGDLPYSGLVADPAGNLYGTTFYGGDYGYGTIYKINVVTHALTTVGVFNVPGSANPVDYGSLVMGRDGNLYGTSAGGGPSHAGTIFEWSAATHNITTLALFDPATTGTTPYGALAMDAGGNLFGVTGSGGANSGGTIFELPAGSHSISVLASPLYNDSSVGSSPTAGLVADKVGNVYGAASGGAGGYGTVFRIDATSHTVTTVASFNSSTGGDPNELMLDPAGNLYGTTSGGAINDGTIFKIDAATHAITTLATFDGSNGKLPQSALIADSSGDLYGTTYFGGANDLGTVFEFNAMTGDLTALVSFDGVTNGAGPFAGLAADARGNLYGTTTGGDLRAYGLGTVFEVSVPEPASLSTLAVGALSLSIRRRR